MAAVIVSAQALAATTGGIHTARSQLEPSAWRKSFQPLFSTFFVQMFKMATKYLIGKNFTPVCAAWHSVAFYYFFCC